MKPSLHTVAIELATRVLHLVGADTTWTMLWRKRLTRQALMPVIAQLPPVLIGIEACGGAHDWARRVREHGPEGKRMVPQFVKPLVKANTHDRRDAEAIAEAVTRPTRRVVPTKAIDRQDLHALHWGRERLIGERTALLNNVQGLMNDYGIVMPVMF
jgi:transposase